MDYSQIAYAKINLDFDREKFVEEYDRCILPNTRSIFNSEISIKKSATLNHKWNMVPNNLYLKMAGFVYIDEYKRKPNNNPIKTWQMEQLMYIDPDLLDDQIKEVTNFGYGGTALLRNLYYTQGPWHYKPEYKDLEITKFIQSLPFEKIVSIHCTSLEPGQFASIHRDVMGSKSGISNGSNILARDGYVVLCLNISNGGVPLYWALDGDHRHLPHKIDDMAYISSDYFLHGVPVVTSRRRQIRITGIPAKEFAELVSSTDIISISDDYEYNSSLMD
jgi:hypothetical protein